MAVCIQPTTYEAITMMSIPDAVWNTVAQYLALPPSEQRLSCKYISDDTSDDEGLTSYVVPEDKARWSTEKRDMDSDSYEVTWNIPVLCSGYSSGYSSGKFHHGKEQLPWTPVPCQLTLGHIPIARPVNDYKPTLFQEETVELPPSAIYAMVSKVQLALTPDGELLTCVKASGRATVVGLCMNMTPPRDVWSLSCTCKTARNQLAHYRTNYIIAEDATVFEEYKERIEHLSVTLAPLTATTKKARYR
jgi:hypothetical protein